MGVGKVPIIPALQAATTRSGPETRNIGAAINGKGALVIQGNDVTVEGLECSEITVRHNNGACIRQEGRNLTLRNVYFHDSQQGILGGGNLGTIRIEDSRFERLGYGGKAHAVYISDGVEKLIITGSHILASKGQGHEVKSRAAVTMLEHNVIASLGGQDSRLVDIPNGGEIVIRYNVLEAGPRSANWQMIGIGLEGIQHPVNKAQITNNIILIDHPRAVLLASKVETVVRGNLLIGGKPMEGNRHFRNRTAAGLPAYPYLPPVPE